MKINLRLFLLYAGLAIACSAFTVAEATAMDSETAVIAFSSNGASQQRHHFFL